MSKAKPKPFAKRTRTRVSDPAIDDKRDKLKIKKTVQGSFTKAQGNSKFVMPKVGKDQEVVEAVQRLMAAAEPERLRYRAECLKNLLYLKGVRDFDAIDYLTGTVKVNTYRIEQLEEGKEDFAFEYILKSYRTETGLLSSSDLRPAVSVVGGNLDGVKYRAVAQAILTDTYPDQLVTNLQKMAAEMLVSCGMCGIYVDAVKSTTYPEVVPPWQLFPVPSDIDSLSDLSGVGRVRKVPLSSLADDLKGKSVSPEKLGAVGIPAGDKPKDDSSMVSSRVETTRKVDTFVGKTGKQADVMEWVDLAEVFLYDLNYQLVRYTAVVGDHLLKDLDFSNDPRVPPLGVQRYLTMGGFYGRSTLFGAIKINTEVEFMLNQLFANVQDLDLMGMVFIPQSWNITDEMYLRARSVSKVAVFDDMTGPGAKTAQPHAITPQNTGTLPREIVGLGIELIDRMMMSSPMFEGKAPGRVDSAAGLQMISESQEVPMTGPTGAMKNLFVGMYAATLDLAGKIWPDETKALSLTMLDETLAGVYYDAASGGVTISRDVIPKVTAVSIGVASEVPVSKAAKRMGLVEGLQNGTLTPMEYRIEIRKNGIDIPVGNLAEYNNYRTATLENIMLYDERTAQTVEVLPTDMHEVHLYKLLEFMGSPEFRFASPQVKVGFQQHYDAHMEAMGQIQEQQPAPEEIGAEQMMEPGMGSMVRFTG